MVAIGCSEALFAQNPVITPKSNVEISLDAAGGYTLTPANIANITDTVPGNNQVTITPSTLSCSDVGKKNITVMAVNTVSNPSAVTFGYIIGMVSDPAGNLMLSDGYWSNLRYIASGGTVTTVGTPNTPYYGPNYVTYAYPSVMTIDKARNVYYASNDEDEHNIYKITPSGVETTVVAEYNNNFGTIDGPLATATFSDIMGITVDGSGNLFITQDTRSVREISTSGIVTTIAGSPNGYAGFLDGQGTAARFGYPEGIVVDASDNLYVVDRDNFAIRKISPTGYVSTFVGGSPGYADGTGTAAKFSGIGLGITIDSQGNLYVTDNNYIRKITPAGVVTTIAGSANIGFTNGQGNAATFNTPLAIAVDGQGNVYVGDSNNDVIRKITPNGTVSTYAGSGQQGDSDGQITKDTGTPVSVTIPVIVKGTLAITSPFPNLNIPVNSNCPTLLADYTKNATASDNCSGTIKFTQDPAPGTAISGSAPVQVGITATDDLGQQATASFTVTPDNSPLPPATITIGTPLTTICANSEITFTALTANAGTQFTYQWLLNGNTVGTNLPTYAANSFKNNDQVACNLTVLNACSQTVGSNTVVLTVRNNLTPAVSVTTIADSVCQGTPVTFVAATANAGINPSYQWKVNGVAAGINANTFTSDALNDEDHIGCTLTNNDPGCLTNISATSPDIIIHVTPLSTATVSIAAVSTGPPCGLTTTYTATVTNSTDPFYQWQVNGNNAGTNQSEFSSKTLSNGDQVSCIITGGSKCLTNPTAASNIIKVNIPPPTASPSVKITTPDNPACAGSPLTFSASVNPDLQGLTYLWEINGSAAGGTGPVFSSSKLNDGDAVSCIVSSDSSCVAPVTSNILSMKIDPLPVIVFNSSPVIKQGASVTLNPTVSGNISSYQWYPATCLSNSNVIDPVATPQGTITYHLVATSATGCQDTAAVTVNVMTSVDIPNTFTPNGDGINDLWEIPSLAYYPKCQVSVFNRYGALIFHSTGYPKAWDGTYNGKQTPSGTYFYLIKLENGSPPYSGFIEVIR